MSWQSAEFLWEFLYFQLNYSQDMYFLCTISLYEQKILCCLVPSQLELKYRCICHFHKAFHNLKKDLKVNQLSIPFLVILVQSLKKFLNICVIVTQKSVIG